MTARLICLLLLSALAGPLTASAPASDDCADGFRHINDDGYREEHYMARTPDCVPGGSRLDTTALQALLAEDPSPVLIDVMAAQDHILPDLERGWIPGDERQHLPGSIWLPNVGLGWIDDEIRHWFAERLRRHTGGERDYPLVFYCLQDCWMAWNAVRRASRLGYTKLYWYADGIDVWIEKELPTVTAEPEPLRTRD